jgi:phosphoribosylformimino-5-aminoimidazole carboxamide ribotide isomerase
VPELIPAIDLRNGRCVRLTQGRRDQETAYGDDPVEQARRWVGAGARRLHVVDLDGAFAGRLLQADSIAALARGCEAPIQVGGGLRTERDLDAVFAAGAERAILGTAALEDEPLLRRALERWGERIAVAVDVRDGQPVARGWETAGEASLEELLRRLRELGARRVVCTDVARDGMLEGPNLLLAGQVARQFGGAVIASGGFTSLEDLQRARRLELLGLEGVIVGKALYEGRFGVREAMQSIGDCASGHGEPGRARREGG